MECGVRGADTLETLEPKAEAVALPVEDFHSITVAIQKNKKHGVEHSDFNIQLDQGSQAIDGLSKVYGLGVEVHFFNFCIGSHHEVLAPERVREHSFEHQISTWNVGFMERLRYYHVPGNTRRLDAFRREIIGAWRHALKRRSQRHRLNWERMTALARLFIPYPRELTMHPYPIARFGVKTQGRSRMR